MKCSLVTEYGLWWTEIVNIKRAPNLLSSGVVYYSSGLFPGNENGRFINK